MKAGSVSSHARLRRWPTLVLLAAMVLLGGCGDAPHAPPAGRLQDVRSIEIRYQYNGSGHADEVHRLQPAAGRRTFVRRSQLDARNPGAVLSEDVPAQRVAELLWALSVPAWPRARGVEEVAHRVRPAQVLARASSDATTLPPACTPDKLQRQMRALLHGAALRDQVDRYYAGPRWSDDAPSMRVVIDYAGAPPQVLQSNAQTLLMLPWVLEQPQNDVNADTNANEVSSTWSVPISQALRRVLPDTSKAYERLGQREDAVLESLLRATARVTCEAQHR